MNRPDNIRGMTGDAAMTRLGYYVGARRDELGWSRDRAATISGIGRQTWDDIEKGRARGYTAKTKQGIMRALGWTPDSWDLILDGGEPVLAPENAATRLEQLEKKMVRLEAAVDTLLTSVDTLLARFPDDPPEPPAS